MGKNNFKKFFKNVEKEMYRKVEGAASNRELSITCPHCKEEVIVVFKDAVGRCPKCNARINLDLKWV